MSCANNDTIGSCLARRPMYAFHVSLPREHQTTRNRRYPALQVVEGTLFLVSFLGLSIDKSGRSPALFKTTKTEASHVSVADF